jgi:hypothetical protein
MPTVDSVRARSITSAARAISASLQQQPPYATHTTSTTGPPSGEASSGHDNQEEVSTSAQRHHQQVLAMAGPSRVRGMKDVTSVFLNACKGMCEM